MAKDMVFGVVGLGMGQHHCKAVTNARGAVLGAACDTDEERLQTVVKTYGCKGYTRWSDMLNDKTIDAICIAVESGKHGEFSVAAAKAGKHLIIEKPVEITPARARKLRDAVKKTGVKAGCIFQSRLDPCNLLIKKAIDQGKMGRMFAVNASLPWYRADSYYEGPHGSWKGTWGMDGGGSLMNQGIHTVDLIQWLAGPVESVCGFYGVFNHRIEAEDQSVAVLKFKNGAIGTLFTSTCCIPGIDQRVYMCGSKGSFSRYGSILELYEMGSPGERKKMMEMFGARTSSENIRSDPMAVAADGHTLTIEDLVKAVRYDRDPIITIDSAIHAVEIADAIFKSARTGRVVKVK